VTGGVGALSHFETAVGERGHKEIEQGPCRSGLCPF